MSFKIRKSTVKRNVCFFKIQIVMGLGNQAVSRMNQTTYVLFKPYFFYSFSKLQHLCLNESRCYSSERLPSKSRKVFAEFESFIGKSDNRTVLSFEKDRKLFALLSP